MNKTTNPCTLLSFKEACTFLKMPESTVYKMTSNRAIPFLKPGKRILFCQEHLEEWLQGFYKKTLQELIIETKNN